MPITIRKIELFCSLLFFSPTSLQRAKNACFSLIFPEKSAFRNGFELRRSDVKKDFFFNIFRRRSVGRIIFRQLPLFSDKYRQFRYIPKNSKSIWQQCHVGSNPTVCAKGSTLRGAAFYFCGKLYKGCKVGFEQPVPGALRPAGLQQSCGLLQGRGRIPPSAPSITTQFYIG